MRLAITGGTGLVGGHLAERLPARGHEVVVVSRGVDQRPWARKVLRQPGVTLQPVGLDDQAALARAFEGCEAVAHCAGINRELGAQTYQAVHVRGTANVVGAAERAGVRRLALLSFLRARPACGSAYHESKWAAEELVRASGLEWTVLKPGMIFGRGDHMLDHLSHALYTFPVYVGVGARRVRPLAVEDVVEVLCAALLDGRLAGRTVPLTGPTELGFDEAARQVARVTGRRPLWLRAPIEFHHLLAAVTERLMSVPLVSAAQVRILAEEVVEPVLAPDRLPADLTPSTPFDDRTIRAGLPEPGRFGRADLRVGRRRQPRRPGMICGEGAAVIKRPPRTVLEFVLDVERYRQADRKIGRVHWVHRDGDHGSVKHDGRLWGLPTPPMVLAFTMLPYTRLDFRFVRAPWPLRDFEGSFTCEETPEGTRVVHRECFSLHPPADRLLGPLLAAWLARDTPQEVRRIKQLLEREPERS